MYIFIEAAERFTADPFSENSGGLWKDFDRLWESFRRISAGSGRIWQDFGRRSAGSGSPGLIFGRKIADSRGVWWLAPALARWLTWRWPGGRREAHTNFFRSQIIWIYSKRLTRLRPGKGSAVFNRFAHSAGPGLVVEGGCAGWTLGGGRGAGVQEGQGAKNAKMEHQNRRS